MKDDVWTDAMEEENDFGSDSKKRGDAGGIDFGRRIVSE
jgi:hypothetical protein